MNINTISGKLLLSTFLFLFSAALFAQSTTITGTVYEKEQSKTEFDTPEGKVTVYLPDDATSGDFITGTVIAEPKGRTERQKNKNREILSGYTLLLTGQVSKTILGALESANNSSKSFDVISIPVPEEGPLSIKLQTPDGEMLGAAEISTLPAFPAVETPADNGTEYTLLKKVISNSEPITILSSFPVNDVPLITLNSYNSDGVFNSYDLESIVHSSRKLVYNLPPGLSGIYSVCTLKPNGESITIDLVNIVKIDASIGKAALERGETTNLTIMVGGLEDCPYSPVQLKLVNQTPSIIQLAEGNVQTFPVDHSDTLDLILKEEPFVTTQTVIGQTSGGFAIQSTLEIPPSAYTNNARAYFDNIENENEFNTSADALKTDIDNYINNNSVSDNTVSYLNRVKESIPLAKNNNDLNFGKSRITNMLNRLIFIPDGNEFLSKLTNLENLHPEIAELKNIPQSVHPLFDLAGEFNSEENVLRTNSADKDALLSYLGAGKTANGSYTFTLSDGDKPVVYSNVALDVNDERVYYNTCDTEKNEVDSESEDAEAKNENNEIPNKDSTEESETEVDNVSRDDFPTESTDFKDSKGKEYKFYKNAECKLLFKPKNNGNCNIKFDEVKNEKTGKKEWKFLGRYSKFIAQDYKVCLKGTGFCTEMNQIISTEMIYEDEDCKRLVEVVTREGFLCQ